MFNYYNQQNSIQQESESNLDDEDLEYLESQIEFIDNTSNHVIDYENDERFEDAEDD